jgi:hypothetical protein
MEKKYPTIEPLFTTFVNHDRIKVYWQDNLFIITKEFNLLRDGKVIISFYEQRNLLFRIQNFKPFTIYVFDSVEKFKKGLEVENIELYGVIVNNEQKYKELKELLGKD